MTIRKKVSMFVLALVVGFGAWGLGGNTEAKAASYVNGYYGQQLSRVYYVNYYDAAACCWRQLVYTNYYDADNAVRYLQYYGYHYNYYIR